MTAEETVLAGRAFAEEQMIDACEVRGPGRASFTAVEGYTPPEGDVVYAGKCRVQVTDSLNAETPEVGGRLVTVQKLVLQLPVAATGLKVGQIATVTAASLDPELVDRTFRVTAVHHKTHATAHRLQCEEVTR